MRRLKAAEVPAIRRDPVDAKARVVAEEIVNAVKAEGEAAVRRYAEKFGEIERGAKLLYTRDAELKTAYESISEEDRACLLRTAARIRAFAAAQAASIREISSRLNSEKR